MLVNTRGQCPFDAGDGEKRTIGHDIGVGVDPLGRESSHGTRVEQAVCRNKTLAAASRLLFKGVAVVLFFELRYGFSRLVRATR